MKQAYEDAKAKTQELATSTVQVVEEHIPPSGNITLRSSSTIDPATSATLELISIGDGRPNVLQVTSYDPAVSARAYPTILLHGTTDASTPQSLAGTKCECDFYLRASSHSAVAMNSPSQRATVVFSTFNAEDNTVTATIAPLELMGSDGKPVQIHGGDMVAVIRPGGR